MDHAVGMPKLTLISTAWLAVSSECLTEMDVVRHLGMLHGHRAVAFYLVVIQQRLALVSGCKGSGVVS